MLYCLERAVWEGAMVGSSMEGGGGPYCATIARENQSCIRTCLRLIGRDNSALASPAPYEQGAPRRFRYAAIAGRRGGVGGKFGRAHTGKTSNGDA